MGILRLYLALCVVAAHSSSIAPWDLHSGREAVQIFYMISGFYMSLIGHKYDSIRGFYLSRFLRIFIPYWIVGIAIIAVSLLCGLATDRWLALRYYADGSVANGGQIGMALASIANVTIFGSDWILFLSQEPGQALSFTNNFHLLEKPLSHYLVNPPAWSIGVEVTFYLLVPWLNRRSSRVLLSLLACSLASRLCFYLALGWDWDPWTYRFFPFEFGLFLLGMLCHRVYSHGTFPFPSMEKWIASLESHRFWFMASAAAILLSFWFLLKARMIAAVSLGDEASILATYILWAIALGGLFHVTKSVKWDRFVGELSYPIYLVHYFIVGLVGAFSTRQLWFSDWMRGPVVACLSIMTALILHRFVISPIEKRRSSLSQVDFKSLRTMLGGGK